MTTTPGEDPGSLPLADASATIPPTPWFTRPAIALAIAGLAYVIAMLLSWPGLREPLAGVPGWASIVFEALVVLGPLLLGALAAAKFGSPRIADALGIRFRPIDLLLGVLVALVARAIMELVVPSTGSLLPMVDGDSVETTVTLIMTIAVVVLLSPIVEEVFFRGAVQRGLQSLFGAPSSGGPAGGSAAVVSTVTSTVLAIELSTLAFVLLHAVPYGAQVPLSVLLAPLLIGIGAGTLTALTGRISAGIVTHVLFNLAGILLLLR